MRNRHLIVGAVTLIASAATYGLVRIMAATPATAGSVEAQSASAGVAVSSFAVVQPLLAASIEAWLESTPDSITLLMTGAALFGIAEGVRRRAA